MATRRSLGTVQLLLGAFLVMGGIVGGVSPVQTAPSAVPALKSAYAAGGSLVYVIALIGGGILIIRGIRNRRG